MSCVILQLHNIDYRGNCEQREERTRLIRLRPLLQSIHVIVKFLRAARPFLNTLLLDVLVVALEELFIRGPDVLDKCRATDTDDGSSGEGR